MRPKQSDPTDSPRPPEDSPASLAVRIPTLKTTKCKAVLGIMWHGASEI